MPRHRDAGPRQYLGDFGSQVGLAWRGILENRLGVADADLESERHPRFVAAYVPPSSPGRRICGQAKVAIIRAVRTNKMAPRSSQGDELRATGLVDLDISRGAAMRREVEHDDVVELEPLGPVNGRHDHVCATGSLRQVGKQAATCSHTVRDGADRDLGAASAHKTSERAPGGGCIDVGSPVGDQLLEVGLADTVSSSSRPPSPRPSWQRPADARFGGSLQRRPGVEVRLRSPAPGRSWP